MEKALALDVKNGNTLWTDAMSKELDNVKMAFDILPDGKKAPKDPQFVQCHIVFDIKMENFRCKARLVVGGHMTKAPATIMYFSIVSRETVRIALMITTIDDLDVKVDGILNTYVKVPATRKGVDHF